jgi:hypothetical protein
MRLTVRWTMAAVAVVAIFVACGTYAEELRQRRKGFLKWAGYHEFAERGARALLERLPWSQVIRIHRLEVNLKARRLEFDEKRQRCVWTPPQTEAAEAELDRLRADLEERRSEARVWVAGRLSELRKEVEAHARLKRMFERAAVRPWTMSSQRFQPPDPEFRCVTGWLSMERIIEQLQSEGVSISRVLSETDCRPAHQGAAPDMKPGP